MNPYRVVAETNKAPNPVIACGLSIVDRAIEIKDVPIYKHYDKKYCDDCIMFAHGFWYIAEFLKPVSISFLPLYFFAEGKILEEWNVCGLDEYGKHILPETLFRLEDGGWVFLGEKQANKKWQTISPKQAINQARDQIRYLLSQG